MKKTNRFWLCLLLTLALAAAFGLTAFAAEPDEIIADGCCGGTGDGTNLTWTLTGDGALTVSGEGPTGDYTAEAPAPYAAYRDDITGVTFTEGVTRLGDYALAGLDRLETISLPASLESVGELTLDGCFSLREIRYAGTYDELCAVSLPEELGDLGEVDLFTLVRYTQEGFESLEWSVEEGVLTFFGEGVIPDAYLYGNTPWFELREEITEVIVPEGFTYIGAYAFAGLENLRSLSLPHSLEGWGDGVMLNCVNFSVFSYNGTMEEFYALVESDNIGDPGLPQSVWEQLEGNLHFIFDEEWSDIDWYVEDGILHIAGEGELPDIVFGAPWYNYVGKIRVIVVEEGVTRLGDNLLTTSPNLRYLVVPSTLESIGDIGLDSCDSLCGILCAFDESRLETLDFMSQISNPYTDAVDYPLYYETPFFPEQIICMGDSLRLYSDGGFYFASGSLRTLLLGRNGTTAWTLPTHPLNASGEPVDSYEIAPFAFGDRTNYYNNYDWEGYDTALTLPATVKALRPYAFAYCATLSRLTAEDGLETVGAFAFAYSRMKTVTLPDTVTEIGDRAFLESCLAEGVRLPAGLETISNGMFYQSSISSLTLPENVRTIGREAFRYCWKLTDITLNSGLEEIDDYAFYYASRLTSVLLPDTVTRLGFHCFDTCSALENIDWSDHLERIEFGCFRSCRSLTSLVLPASLKHLEGQAFQWCTGLTSVVLPEGMEFCDSDFLTEYYLYDGADEPVAEHHYYPVQAVFSGCSSLRQITLPASVTYIGWVGMFSRCTALESVTIKGNVEYISPATFRNCPALRELFLPGCSQVFGISEHDANDPMRCNNYSNVFGSYDDELGSVMLPFTGDIYFNGTPEQWAQVYAPKDDLSGATVHFPETRSLEPTCTAHGYRNAVYYSGSDYVIDPGEFLHAWGHSPETVAATEATATEHGYTEGVYCERCREWLSGHEVIHNTLGETTVLQKPTATQAGECLITCTVCGEQGLYAMEPATPADPEPADPQPGDDDPAEETDNSAFGRLRKAMKSIIEFFLRLLKWLGVNKQN